MSAIGVATTSLTPADDFQMVANLAEQGVLRVAFASANPIGADGAILQLQFLPTDGISSLDFGQIRLNNRLGRDFVTSSDVLLLARRHRHQRQQHLPWSYEHHRRRAERRHDKPI